MRIEIVTRLEIYEPDAEAFRAKGAGIAQTLANAAIRDADKQLAQLMNKTPPINGFWSVVKIVDGQQIETYK